MSDLLKEAIADAKTVRETAIANAKMALEEAFTPHLKSMLSAKLAEDDMEDDEDEKKNPFDGEETYGDEDEMAMADKDEMAMKDEDEMEMEPEMGDDEPEMGDDEPEMEQEGVIEINGVKYAPVMSEVEDEDEMAMADKDEMKYEGEDQELDLESVIKELETEITEGEDDDKDDEDDKVKEEIVTEKDDDDDKDEMKEQSKSSGIGGGDNKVNKASASDEEDPGKGKDKPMSNESVELKAELKEYKEAVTFLREKLHEVNILNAKLLYTNRLFKEYVLSNDQKMKIVETFDRAQTSREIKLVYSTLAESFKGGSIKKTRVQESASVGTTKPTKKIITEESEVANRFKKLAGILN